jgi:hypothetical protein
MARSCTAPGGGVSLETLTERLISGGGQAMTPAEARCSPIGGIDATVDQPGVRRWPIALRAGAYRSRDGLIQSSIRTPGIRPR